MCVQESVCVSVKEGRNEKKAGGSVANRRRRWCEKEQRESGVAGKGVVTLSVFLPPFLLGVEEVGHGGTVGLQSQLLLSSL
ncbi:hypothetical protein PAMP_021324 [Pampus punctatissimus]